MSVPQAVMEVYSRALPDLRVLAAAVESTIGAWTKAHDYLFRGRIKTASSTGEKLEGGRFGSWAEIDDLYACLVVVPDRNHTQAALEFMERAFDVREIRGRGRTRKSPDVFRFDAPRIVANLRPLDRGAADDIHFEVQMLTAFEYAWQVATHDSIYKADTIDWRRARLAGHLVATAEQADSLIAAFEQTIEAIPLSNDMRTSWRTRIVGFFEGELSGGAIPSTLKPESWLRFADNVIALVESYVKRDQVSTELDALEVSVRSMAAASEIPISGSLFQLTVAALVASKGEKAIKKHKLVESTEFSDIYRLARVPKAVSM
jgi:hypothetical protein